MELSPQSGSSSGAPGRVDLSTYSSDASRSVRSFSAAVRGDEGVPSSCPVVRPQLASMVVRPVVPAARSPVASRLGGRVQSLVEEPVEEGWHGAGKKRPRSRRRLSPVLPARVVNKDILPEMAEKCFNCLGDDHVAALCTNASYTLSLVSHRGSWGVGR